MNIDNNKNTDQERKPSKLKALLKKFGIAGFLFFFLKGLVWIAVFILGVEGCKSFF